MSLEDAAKLAREHADVCIDRGCHVVANALEGALAAERLAAKYAVNPPAGDTSDLPPWSAVSAPRTAEADAD
jgi:hypothetical protein